MLAAAGRHTVHALAVLVVAYATALCAARLLGLLPDVFTPLSLLGVPAVAALYGAARAWGRTDLRAAARCADRALGTDDLFLTAVLIDDAPGAYHPLVRRKAAARAGEIRARAAVPFAWAQGAGRSVAALTLLWLAVVLVPQLDPFGRQEAAAAAAEQRDALEQTRTATAVRRARLRTAPEPQGVSAEVDQALEALRSTFRSMEPGDGEANRERLRERQQELGRLWRAAQAQRLREGAGDRLARQDFGASSQRRNAWQQSLREGNTEALRKELQALQELARRAATEGDAAARRSADRELKQRLADLAAFAAQDLRSAPLGAALERALDQLRMGRMPELSEEALEALQESLELAQMEMDRTQQQLDDQAALEEALRALQLAQQCNNVRPLDGAGAGQCQGMGDYASLYESLMQQRAGTGQGAGQGMRGPGTGEGGEAPEDDAAESDFRSEKARSALRAGKILMQWQTGESAERGAATRDVAAEVRAVEQGVHEAIAQEQIPPGYHAGIQGYFDALKETADAPAPTTP